MNPILRCLADFRLAAFIMLAWPLAAQANGSEIYVFEGVQFDASERARIGAANDKVERGIEALKRNDWATAHSECSAAYETYTRVRLPARGLGAQAYKWALACISDSQAGRGDWYMACRTYSGNGYFSLRFGDQRQACAQKGEPTTGAAATGTSRPGSAAPTHSEYAAAFAAFAGRLERLNALPGGSARSAMGLELANDCARLRTFGWAIPPAPAAANYCAGVVAFERNNANEACRTMWTGAGSIRIALRGQMLQEQRNHGAELQSMLDTFGPICADMGYTWPGFDQTWQH